ncbi:MFS transporter [Nocardioides zeae]|uniref:MFS transporter n=1 Tax=Nocardioides imazamoxiresistens TaxID=3231893 RepID=A0ABU3PZF8_9ACTN|nr:MFS transporter [Nocardioides zeae]MDT9594653.1 MFS transporter [Nocardioides zeae]
MNRAPLGSRYRRLLGSAVAANLGDGLVLVAVMWLASSLTRDPLLITLLGLASRLPWLVLSLPAGVLVDRVDRRLLVGTMDLVRCAAVAALGVLVWTQQDALPTPAELAGGAPTPASAPLLLAGLGVVTLVLGCAEVVRDNAAQTLMPSLVERDQLERANSRLWGAETTMNSFVGPPLGGVLVAVALAVPFLTHAGLLAVSAVLVLGIGGAARRGARAAPDAQDRRPRPARAGWRAELAEGFGWLWRHRLLRTLALLLGVMNMLSSAAFVVVVLFVQEILGILDGWAFGLVTTGAAAGAVAGSLVGDRIVARLSAGRALAAAVLVMGLGLLVVATTSSPVVFWLAEVVTGLAVVVWNVVTVSMRQRLIPDALLGRVNSVYRFFGWGMMSAGALLGGGLVALGEPLLGREAALRAPVLLAALGYLVLLPVAWRHLHPERVAAAESAAAGAR